ncbi:MAG: serine hydrolase [Proteobacteria bacterium]|nr:serine hydrolase [Pseudomonadota bacterium]
MFPQAPIDAVLKAGIANRNVPGVTAAVTSRDGMLYEAGFGERCLGEGTAMTVDTVGWIASMTKAITGTAVMQLVEQGRLDLDAPASAWAPYLGEVQVLEGFGAGGRPLTRAPKRAITMRHLLTHSAGFGYPNWNEDIQRYAEIEVLPVADSGDIRAFMTPLVFDPGERWLYSIGIDWAGKIVEAVSGKTLGAYLQEAIFEPLGMVSTGFRITPAMRARLARVHRRQNGALIPIDMELRQDPPSENGGGGLYSTVGDYLKFIQMILNGGTGNGQRVLQDETVRMMSRNQMGDCRVTKLPTFNAEMSLDAEFFPGIPKTWGLTFMLNTEAAPTGRSANSLAWAGLTNSYYWIDPEKGIGGAFMSQVLPFVDEQALALYLDFETAVYDNLC